MSKKHKKAGQSPSTSSAAADMHAGEYQIIKHDLIKVVLLNVVYLGLVLAVYFTNAKTHYLEQWFGRVLNF